MIKILLFIIPSFQGLGQLYINCNLGLNYSQIHDKLVPFDYNFKPRLLWKGGMQFEYFIDHSQSIEAGLYLSARGAKINPGLFQTTNIVTYYLYENTLMFRKYFYKNNLGIGLGICNTWPQSYGIHLFEDKEYYLDLVLGFKLKLNDWLQFDTSFLFGDLITYFNKEELFYFSVYNISFSITLGKFLSKPKTNK